MTTASDKQVLLNIIKNEITLLEKVIIDFKKLATTYYDKSDKNSITSSLLYFLALNDARTEIRIAKKRIKRLATIAKNLKKDIKESGSK